MPVYEFEGMRPVVDPTAFVHPTAVLIGDVIIGARCFVGPLAALRADTGRIRMEPGSNLQDNCTIHVGTREMVIETDGHIGHGVTLHGCRIGRGALVGMGAIVLDGADIGEYAFVGAQSYVPYGFELPDRHLALGIPAKVVREVTEAEIDKKIRWTAGYHQLADGYLAGMREVAPLTEEEPGRRQAGQAGQAVRTQRTP